MEQSLSKAAYPDKYREDGRPFMPETDYDESEEARPASEMSRTLDGLHSELEKLDSRIQTLFKRLQPVLRPTDPSAEKAEAHGGLTSAVNNADMARTTMGQGVAAGAARAKQSRAKIDQIINSLEV